MTEHTEPTPFAGDVVAYTLTAFAEELQAELVPIGIEIQLEEAEDGTRTVRAWQSEAPDAVSVFPLDHVRILPYQAHVVATVIRRSFARPNPSA
jgi:hypothetical protein